MPNRNDTHQRWILSTPLERECLLEDAGVPRLDVTYYVNKHWDRLPPWVRTLLHLHHQQEHVLNAEFKRRATLNPHI